MKNKPATLHTLANQLNIHVSTVSRVLNGDDAVAAKAASKETIEKVRALAKASGYTHNPHAISLRTRQSHLVGVSVPRLSDIIWATIYEGIEETATENHYNTYITNSYDDITRQVKLLEVHKARRVDGLILGDSRTTQDSMDFLNSIPVPFVLVFRKVGNFPYVVCDDYLGGQLAARHLLERGHKEVGLLGGRKNAFSCFERARGFTDTFRSAGFAVPENRILWGEFDTEGGRVAAHHLITENPSLTALYLVNDFAAIGALSSLREAGHSPGVTMALIGYNDTPLAAALPVPLTTLRNPLMEVGQRSMEVLLKILRGEPWENVVLKPELIVRESSACSSLNLM